MGDWTLSYFTWWIAWSPFVGIFIARISKGRTLRELIVGCLLVPTGFCIFWFAVFGGTALYLQRIEGIDVGPAMLEDVSLATFVLFEQLPLSGITSLITVVLLFTFLVTSADSATFVVSMMTSEGNLEPPLKTKVVWGLTLAVLTLVLVAGGGMEALQAATLVFAFPFAIVLVLMAVSLRFRLSIQVRRRRV
jgi:glycine betaine transporter